MTEDAEALRAEIQVTRAELGETAQALAAKADVKGRAKEAAVDAKDRAVEVVRERPVPPLVIAVVGAAAIALAIFARKRKKA